jgi:hypothetical protein
MRRQARGHQLCVISMHENATRSTSRNEARDFQKSQLLDEKTRAYRKPEAPKFTC